MLYNKNYCIDFSKILQEARLILILHKYVGRIIGWVENIPDFQGLKTQTF
jgi:hypothetical protein